MTANVVYLMWWVSVFLIRVFQAVFLFSEQELISLCVPKLSVATGEWDCEQWPRPLMFKKQNPEPRESESNCKHTQPARKRLVERGGNFTWGEEFPKKEMTSKNFVGLLRRGWYSCPRSNYLLPITVTQGSNYTWGNTIFHSSSPFHSWLCFICAIILVRMGRDTHSVNSRFPPHRQRPKTKSILHFKINR